MGFIVAHQSLHPRNRQSVRKMAGRDQKSICVIMIVLEVHLLGCSYCYVTLMVL